MGSAALARTLKPKRLRQRPPLLRPPPAARRNFANDPLEKICRIGPRSREVEIQRIEPFKVFDNLYHVGPCYVTSWVLTTPQGHIMFDTAQEPFVGLIEENIRKVGINPRDIKYIVVNHGHTDHFGGAKRLQEFTGARVVAAPQDWKMIEDTAGKPNNRDNGKPTDAPKRDMEVNGALTSTLAISTSSSPARATAGQFVHRSSCCVTARRPIAASGWRRGGAPGLPVPSKG